MKFVFFISFFKAFVYWINKYWNGNDTSLVTSNNMKWSRSHLIDSSLQDFYSLSINVGKARQTTLSHNIAWSSKYISQMLVDYIYLKKYGCITIKIIYDGFVIHKKNTYVRR